jgi:hypothetical protein
MWEIRVQTSHPDIWGPVNKVVLLSFLYEFNTTTVILTLATLFKFT